MPKNKTELQKAIGKLISLIQKEWGKDLGEDYSEVSEEIMNKGHDLLKATTKEDVKKLLGQLTVRQYMGEIWLQAHPGVKEQVIVIEKILEKEN